MSKNELIILTNINNEDELFSHLTESFTKEQMPYEENKLEEVFSRGKFILSVINGDEKYSDSYLNSLVNILNKTGYPALVLASKFSLNLYSGLFPVTVDFIAKPVDHFEFHLRVTRLMEIYKVVEKLNLLKRFEEEIGVRDNVVELSRQELILGAETIKALDVAMELSRQELLKQKEEINARELLLEYNRKDKMDMLSHINALERIIYFSDKERTDYKQEIDALENLLEYIFKLKKEEK